MEYTISEHNAQTNEIITRPMTNEEIKNYQKIQNSIEANQKELAIKEKNRISALAKLAALGLTEEEIAAL